MNGAQARACTTLPDCLATLWRFLRPAVALLVLGVVGAGIAWGVGVLRDPEIWPIRRVQLEGEIRFVDAEALKAVIAPQTGQSFFALDGDALAASLGAQPWVARIDVRRVYPDTLRVTVTEHVPFALWGDTEIVTEEGVRFTRRGDERLPPLPSLDGADGAEREVIGHFTAWRERVRARGLELDRLAQDARGAFTLGFSGGLVMRIGREEPESRLERALAAWPQLGRFGQRVTVLDARYANGLAVQWAETPDPLKKIPPAATAGHHPNRGVAPHG